MSNEEQQLKQLTEMFEQQSEMLNDNEFSGFVIHRIRRRIWIRQLIFAVLSVLLILIALTNDVFSNESFDFANLVDVKIWPTALLSAMGFSLLLLLADE